VTGEFLNAMEPTEGMGRVPCHITARLEQVMRMVREYPHDVNCSLIVNVQEFVLKALVMAQQHGRLPTVHDILQEWCHYCGHSQNIRVKQADGQYYQLQPHTTRTCRRLCCGGLVDRDTLQFRGATCLCGKKILAMVARTVSVTWEWWKGLYVWGRDGEFSSRVKQFLRKYFQKMERFQPCTVALCVISEGPSSFESLRRMPTWRIIEILWEIIRILNEQHENGGRWNWRWVPRSSL
jgi:hypothetical protein